MSRGSSHTVWFGDMSPFCEESRGGTPGRKGWSRSEQRELGSAGLDSSSIHQAYGSWGAPEDLLALPQKAIQPGLSNSVPWIFGARQFWARVIIIWGLS